MHATKARRLHIAAENHAAEVQAASRGLEARKGSLWPEEYAAAKRLIETATPRGAFRKAMRENVIAWATGDPASPTTADEAAENGKPISVAGYRSPFSDRMLLALTPGGLKGLREAWLAEGERKARYAAKPTPNPAAAWGGTVAQYPHAPTVPVPVTVSREPGCDDDDSDDDVQARALPEPDPDAWRREYDASPARPV